MAQKLPNGGAVSSAPAPAVWPPAFQPGPLPQQSFPSLAAAACSAGMPPAGLAWGSIPPMNRGGHGIPLPWTAPFGQPQPGQGQGQVPGVPVPGFPVPPHWPGQSFLPPTHPPSGSHPSMIGTLPTGPMQQAPANGQPAVSLTALPFILTILPCCAYRQDVLSRGCCIALMLTVALVRAGKSGSIHAAECPFAEQCWLLHSPSISGMSICLTILTDPAQPCVTELFRCMRLPEERMASPLSPSLPSKPAAVHQSDCFT